MPRSCVSAEVCLVIWQALDCLSHLTNPWLNSHTDSIFYIKQKRLKCVDETPSTNLHSKELLAGVDGGRALPPSSFLWYQTVQVLHSVLGSPCWSQAFLRGRVSSESQCPLGSTGSRLSGLHHSLLQQTKRHGGVAMECDTQ